MNPIFPVVAQPPENGYEVIPRISIHHDTTSMTFNDVPLTREQMKNLILLGGARQRNMFNWDDSVGPRGLECESKDFEIGNPTDLFPWEESNFPNKAHVVGQLDCGSCIFKDWHKDPMAPRGSVPPLCVEQVAALILVPIRADIFDETESAEFKLGVLMFQKSSLKPVNEYFKKMRMRKTPPYMKLTSITLNKNLGKGDAGQTFGFSVPSLTEHREVDSDVYPLLSRVLREGRAALSKPTPKPAPKAAGMLSVSSASAEDKGERYTGTFF